VILHNTDGEEGAHDGDFVDHLNAMLAAGRATEKHRITWCDDVAVAEQPELIFPVPGTGGAGGSSGGWTARNGGTRDGALG
jgi:hypothetical protein